MEWKGDERIIVSVGNYYPPCSAGRGAAFADIESTRRSHYCSTTAPKGVVDDLGTYLPMKTPVKILASSFTRTLQLASN